MVFAQRVFGFSWRGKLKLARDLLPPLIEIGIATVDDALIFSGLPFRSRHGCLLEPYGQIG